MYYSSRRSDTPKGTAEYEIIIIIIYSEGSGIESVLVNIAEH